MPFQPHHKRARGALIVATLLCWVATVGAQDQPANRRKMPFDWDYAQFRSGGDQVYFEIYYALFRGQLKFEKVDDRYQAVFGVEVTARQGDSVVVQQRWNSVNYADSLEEIEDNQILFTVANVPIPKGEYDFTTRIIDLNSERSSSLKFRLPMIHFSRQVLTLSDIQLGTSIVRSEAQNRYVKNGYWVTPNPSAIYGSSLPMLYFYVEVYNLLSMGEAPGDSTYRVTYSVVDDDGGLIRDYPTKLKKKPGTSAVEVGGFNIVTLPTGTYNLRIEVADSAGHRTASAQKKFYVYRAGDKPRAVQAVRKPDIANLIGSEYYNEFDDMTLKELDEEFSYARYIRSHEEGKTYKQLKESEGKRRFLREFWAKRDDRPETRVNEFRDDYLGRVKYANDHFSGFKKGWRSDLGRVLLIYGRPDEIERHPGSGDGRAYQVWQYFSIQGGVFFVFVDRKGWGDLELVHSTARSELQDTNWQRWINPVR